MENYLENAKHLFDLEKYELCPVVGHEGGRNLVYVCFKAGEPEYILRLSLLGDRSVREYSAEAGFIRYLAENGAPVADVIPSVNGNYVESFLWDGKECFAMLFSYAKGMLISDNGYRYREGAPLEEYFYNTGKALGAIHRLSKEYKPADRRPEYFDKYDREYIDALIPDEYDELKKAIGERLDNFRRLPVDEGVYGLVHFDFSDGNYHIDMNTGNITVFDFDNCMYCWYMFDLANLWTHGIGWFQNEPDGEKRKEYMKGYFDTILAGYRSETDVSDDMLEKLPVFIDMVLIENIVDEFECCIREGEELDPEDIEDAAACLTNHIPYAGYFE
ncbi:MAG: phosphotransferase [Lachnospiraceae bacterium]|nr:phosphotransferase [Lachnospiraceae bacterium]